jgi:membrane protease YdiL (CAAX protease family)
MSRNTALPSHAAVPPNLLTPVLSLALGFAAMRAAAMFGPVAWRNLMPVMFVAMALWVTQMYLLSLAFAWLRDLSGSVWPAVAAHAAFNAAMNVAIFQFLWY